MSEATSLGGSIRARRQARGMSQRAFAKAIGVAAPTACEWEAGKIHPTLPKLRAIATLFGCTIDELVGPALTTEEDTIRDNPAPEAA